MTDSTFLAVSTFALVTVTGLTASLSVLLSYLVGSIPFGYTVARVVKGIDIREHGSGNIGATNVGRILGRHWFLAVLLLDFLKGLLPVLMVRWGFADASGSGGSGAWYTERAALEVFCGTAAIVGHLWPFSLRFRGGKGVATSLGVILVLAPWATLVAFVVWGGTVASTRYMSLGSMLAAVSFATWQVVSLANSPGPLDAGQWSLLGFSVAVPLLVLIRHRANWKRLLQGTELRIGPNQKAERQKDGDGQTGDRE